MEVPLPWERLLWSGRPALHPVWAYVRGVRYFVTDFRLVRVDRGGSDELALHDIGEINRIQSRLDRLAGTSTIEVQPRDRDAIVRFMNTDVMPWARATLGPLKGGPDRVTCATCHGRDAESRDWRMPAVAALPQPDVRDGGWEIYSSGMDAQMRNAIYGYLAESDKQAKAAYMRETVMPGMSRLLHRPAYDFTRSYAYNRSRLAFGCYHCHRVK